MVGALLRGIDETFMVMTVQIERKDYRSIDTDLKLLLLQFEKPREFYFIDIFC